MPGPLLVCAMLSLSHAGDYSTTDIMHELWNVPSYQRRNRYCSTACITDLVQELPDGEDKAHLEVVIARITGAYEVLSNKYHREKARNPKNSLPFA